jgi:VanZ family protein
MGSPPRVLRRWLAGYVVVLLGSLPFALTVWTRWLRDTVGRLVSLEAIHVIQYVGLGWLGMWYGSSGLARRARVGLWALLLGIGWIDEGIQGQLPQRVFEWSDVGWNWVGLALGAVVSFATRKHKP